MQTKTRNVHAFLRGFISGEMITTKKILHSIKYNPFKNVGFHYIDNNKSHEVKHANLCSISSEGLTCVI